MKSITCAALFTVCSWAAASSVHAEAWNTSGPADGSTVLPSTVFQKTNEELQQGRSVSTPPQIRPGVAGGMPGVEALPGTEGGRVPTDAPSVDRNR
jgi:hypothetical protein